MVGSSLGGVVRFVGAGIGAVVLVLGCAVQLWLIGWLSIDFPTSLYWSVFYLFPPLLFVICLLVLFGVEGAFRARSRRRARRLMALLVALPVSLVLLWTVVHTRFDANSMSISDVWATQAAPASAGQRRSLSMVRSLSAEQRQTQAYRLWGSWWIGVFGLGVGLVGLSLLRPHDGYMEEILTEEDPES